VFADEREDHLVSSSCGAAQQDVLELSAREALALLSPIKTLQVLFECEGGSFLSRYLTRKLALSRHKLLKRVRTLLAGS
jgi:hypothetical protein